MGTTTIKNPSRNSNRIFIIIVAAVVIAMISGLTFMVMNAKEDKNTVYTPENLTASIVSDGDNGTYIEFKNNKDNGKYVDDYSDPLCKYCKMYRESNYDAINDAIDDGTAYRYHMLTFLDGGDPSGYSHRNTEALIHLVENGEVEAAWNLYKKTWGSTDTTNQGLVDKATGISNESKDFILNMNNTDRAVAADKRNTDKLDELVGEVSTPTVFVNDEQVVNPVQSDKALREALGI